jgi:phosphatidate cytidylyltransferase
MALNIRTLGIRALSALVFVVILLGSLLYDYYSFSIFFFIVALWGLKEFFNIAEKMGYRPFKTAGMLMGVLIYFSFLNTVVLFNREVMDLQPFLIIIPFLIFSLPVFSHRNDLLKNAFITVGGLLYTILPFALLHESVFALNHNELIYFPYTLIGIVLLIWCNDTFAYLGGSLYGKRKMIERISPGKTWEGTATGLVASFAASFLISNYFLGNESLFWLLAGIAVPLLATTGDLVQSLAKRQAGIKDSGKVMPGHGGILDRFDSLIFVSPFVVALLKITALLSVSG